MLLACYAPVLEQTPREPTWRSGVTEEKKGLHLRRDRGRRSFCSLKQTRVHANRRPPDAITDFPSTPNLNVFFSQPQLPPNLL
jgi:hypothetical protein